MIDGSAVNTSHVFRPPPNMAPAAYNPVQFSGTGFIAAGEQSTDSLAQHLEIPIGPDGENHATQRNGVFRLNNTLQ
jgi:hypothetical protein